MSKGPTKAQLQGQVRRLETKLKRYEKPDQLRKEGEHWYELIEHFDANKIRRVPVKEGRAFIMGSLGETVVVEVSKELSGQKNLVQLSQWLEKHGIDALIVIEGVKFMKLRACEETVEKMLDAHQVQKASDGKEAPEEPGSQSEQSDVQAAGI